MGNNSKNNLLSKIILFFAVFFLSFLAVKTGIEKIYLDSDLARDLFELSNIKLHHFVWLGPRLSAGFHASPIYYYILYPALVVGGYNPRAILFLTLFFGMLALLFFGFLGIRKWGVKTIAGVIFLGTMPWWQTIVVHPGNGYTYAIWIFIGLVLMWFELPLIFSAFFLGLAFSYHPATFFVLPILFYEWWRKENKFLNLVCLAVFFLLPWSPIIVFEIITKGYLIRQWLAHPGFGLIQTELQFGNWSLLFSLFGLTWIIFFLVWSVLGLLSARRIKFWYLGALPGLFFLAVFKVPSHYLFGITCLIWFVFVVSLLSKKKGIYLLILLAVISFLSLVLSPSNPDRPNRTISQIESAVDTAINKGQLRQKNKVAVVSALLENTKVPQADDYRFFLRMRGIDAPDISGYSQADRLIMFIEEPNFAWSSWSTWEIEQFGGKKLLSEHMDGRIKILIFGKK